MVIDILRFFGGVLSAEWDWMQRDLSSFVALTCHEQVETRVVCVNLRQVRYPDSADSAAKE